MSVSSTVKKDSQAQVNQGQGTVVTGKGSKASKMPQPVMPSKSAVEPSERENGSKTDGEKDRLDVTGKNALLPKVSEEIGSIRSDISRKGTVDAQKDGDKNVKSAKKGEKHHKGEKATETIVEKALKMGIDDNVPQANQAKHDALTKLMKDMKQEKVKRTIGADHQEITSDPNVGKSAQPDPKKNQVKNFEGFHKKSTKKDPSLFRLKDETADVDSMLGLRMSQLKMRQMQVMPTMGMEVQWERDLAKAAVSNNNYT